MGRRWVTETLAQPSRSWPTDRCYPFSASLRRNAAIVAASIYFAALVLVCAAYSGAGEAADLATSPRATSPDRLFAKYRPPQSTTQIITRVFGARGHEALRVSWCESRWHTDARNGQYLGLFQMGSWERRTYGHGPGAWAQSRAAHRYFTATGSDWSPWECKP